MELNEYFSDMYMVSMTFSRDTQEPKSLTVGYKSNHVKVHFRMNKHGISSYKSSPRQIRMSQYDGTTPEMLEMGRKAAVEFVKGFTGKDFNKSYKENLEKRTCTDSNCGCHV